MRRVTVVHNLAAGGGGHTRDDLITLLTRAGYDVVYRSVHSSACKRALEDPGELVVVAGGDGTVRKVATRLVGKGVPMAVLPLGTANNIATSFGLTGSRQDFVDGLRSAPRMKFDVGVARGPWGSEVFFESFGLGLFADVMESIGPTSVRGSSSARVTAPFAPALSALRDALGGYRAHDLGLTLDGEPVSGRYLLLEAMNIGLVGPNLLLAPDADPSDGVLDFVLLTEDRRDELEQYLRYRLERKQEAPVLIVRRGRSLKFTWHGSMVRFDDQAWPSGTVHESALRELYERATREGQADVEVSLRRAGLEILIPRQVAPRAARLRSRATPSRHQPD
jgi:diacylglycerol kinase family enzyme